MENSFTIMNKNIGTAISNGPPPADGSEESFHKFWDNNIRNHMETFITQGDILALILPGLWTDNTIQHDEEIKIKFAGDGCQVAREIDQVMLAFCKAKLPQYNWTLHWEIKL